eukprot:783473-Rhodomonas_salina.1
MEEGAWAARMPCGHYFAHEGLLQWLNQNNTCPVCRFEIPTVDEEYNRYKDVSLARTQEAARVANGQSADIVGQRMRRAQAQMLEEVLTAELNKLPPAASRSALGPGDATMEEEGGNVLLRELHRERALRAQQKQALNSEEAAVESALLEVLLARQHQLCAHALPQGEAVDGGLLPFSVKGVAARTRSRLRGVQHLTFSQLLSRVSVERVRVCKGLAWDQRARRNRGQRGSAGGVVVVRNTRRLNASEAMYGESRVDEQKGRREGQGRVFLGVVGDGGTGERGARLEVTGSQGGALEAQLQATERT